ncbi:MAG: PilZ domain-containing protein [Thermodesulfobacteriota bacterium]
MKRDATDSDKRKFPRVPGRVAIQVNPLVRSLDRSAGALASAKDISGSGMCFQGGDAYAPGTRLSLSIRLPGSRGNAASAPEPPSAIQAIAVVVWCRPEEETQDFSVGIRFVDIYEADYRALTSYLKGGA